MILPALLMNSPTFSFVERWSTPATIGNFSGNDLSFRVVGNRIFYFENDFRKPQIFGCIDATTGKRLWRTVGPVSTASYIDANSRHLMASTEKEIMHLDQKTGRVLWRAKRTSYRAGPIVAGDRMFYEPMNGVLVAIDLRTHRRIWQKAFPYGLSNGFTAGTAVVGNDLLLTTDAGLVIDVAQSNGALRWKAPIEKSRIFRFQPLGDSVLAVGERFTALRLHDGHAQWTVNSSTASAMAFVPATRQIWSLPDDGRLYRFSATNGKSLGAIDLGPEAAQNFQSPLPYDNGFLLPTRESLVKLDTAGHPTAKFEAGESLSEVWPLGKDLIVRTGDRIIRFSPGVDSLPSNLQALLSKSKLSPKDKRSILRLGKAAVSPIIAEIPRAKGDRQSDLQKLLFGLADRSDTRAVLALALKLNTFARDNYPGYISEWLRTKGDPNLTAEAVLAKFRSASTDEERSRYLAYILNGTSKSVVDELVAQFKSPQTETWIRSAIYSSFAVSGRPDVLALIRETRSTGRQLAVPAAEFSATADHDGDGLPDNVDANPFVAPRPLTEKENVLYAMFDARFRFDERTKAIGQLNYGQGVRPFELVGWSGSLVPEDKMAEAGLKEPEVPSRRYKFPFVRFEQLTTDGTMIVFSKNGTEATAAIGVTYGGLDGTGFKAQLRKIDGEWYVVSLTQTWIS